MIGKDGLMETLHEKEQPPVRPTWKRLTTTKQKEAIIHSRKKTGKMTLLLEGSEWPHLAGSVTWEEATEGGSPGPVPAFNPGDGYQGVLTK